MTESLAAELEELRLKSPLIHEAGTIIIWYLKYLNRSKINSEYL